MWILGSILIVTSLLVLYLKYRVVFTGEKCKGKIIDIVEQNAGYSVGGVNVKKHAYIVKIKNKKYYVPGENKNEQAFKAYWDKIKGKK